MAEYRPLISHSQDVDDELELLKADGKISHHSNIFQAENHTALVWFAILMAVTAMSVAAVLHISVSSATSRLQPMRSPNDITSTLTIAQSDTNLQKGRAIMRHKGLKRESHWRGSRPYPLTCAKNPICGFQCSWCERMQQTLTKSTILNHRSFSALRWVQSYLWRHKIS